MSVLEVAVQSVIIMLRCHDFALWSVEWILLLSLSVFLSFHLLITLLLGRAPWNTAIFYVSLPPLLQLQYSREQGLKLGMCQW